MSAELVLAAIGGADLCLRYGQRLVEVYQQFRHADEYIKAQVLVIEAIWHQTSVQIGFVRRIAGKLEGEHCRIQVEVLSKLKVHLEMAISAIESVVKKKAPPSPPQSSSASEEKPGINEIGIKRWKLIFLRETLDKTVSDLKEWQRMFDPTWYLILLVSDKVIDSELRKEDDPDAVEVVATTAPQRPAVEGADSTLSTAQRFRRSIKNATSSGSAISLAESGLDWNSIVTLHCSTTQIIRRKGSTKAYLIDSIACSDPAVNPFSIRADAEGLARKLEQVLPGTFGLLPCHGVVKRRHPAKRQLASIHLAFKIPPGIEAGQVYSLRYHFLHSARPSLTNVLSIAGQLAKAVSFVHTCDFVHKNIRPESILVCPPDGGMVDSGSLGSTYLLGFDSFRSVNFDTHRKGATALDQNLYRHPSRQGILAREKYVMQHDIYSLGVCLLELGLWESFVTRREPAEGAGSCTQRASVEVNLPPVGGSVLCTTREEVPAPAEIKDYLVSLAKSSLPVRAGNKYTAVVVTCLTCLDPGNEDFGDEADMQDEDGILIGVRFIEKVLFKLGQISV